MLEDTKKCPYCGAEIKSLAKKCRFCGKWLEKNKNNQNSDIGIETKYELEPKCTININLHSIKKIFVGILITTIIILIVWIIFGDYPSITHNRENIWYGPYLSSGILHTLLAILCTQILILIKNR